MHGLRACRMPRACDACRVRRGNFQAGRPRPARRDNRPCDPPHARGRIGEYGHYAAPKGEQCASASLQQTALRSTCASASLHVRRRALRGSASPRSRGRPWDSPTALVEPPRLRPHWPIRPLRCPQGGAIRFGLIAADRVPQRLRVGLHPRSRTRSSSLDFTPLAWTSLGRPDGAHVAGVRDRGAGEADAAVCADDDAATSRRSAPDS